MFRLPKTVRSYLSASHLPLPPAVPMIGPLASRWRHDFAAGLDIAARNCAEGRRAQQKILHDAVAKAIR